VLNIRLRTAQLICGVIFLRQILNHCAYQTLVAVQRFSFSGIQILLIFPVNFGTSFNGTSKENHSRYFLYRESAAAAIGGVFFLLTFTSSIYNLVYLAGQRLYAFVRPIHYRMQRKRNISLGLGVVWILAIVSATVLGKTFFTSFVESAIKYSVRLVFVVLSTPQTNY